MANKHESQANSMGNILPTQDITINLSTRPTVRLWEGRERTDKRHGILGIPGFCKLMRNIEESIKQDDPYADFYYCKVENAVNELAFDLDHELKSIESIISENVPEAMVLPDVANNNPIVVPVRFSSRLGFQVVYQLLKIDQIVLKVLSANHIGILPNNIKFATIARVEKRLRGVLNIVYQYKHTSVTRDDMAVNNKRAQAAKSSMGDLEDGYLDGTTRSENAPALPRSRLKALSAAKKTEGQESIDSELDRILGEEIA